MYASPWLCREREYVTCSVSSLSAGKLHVSEVGWIEVEAQVDEGVGSACLELGRKRRAVQRPVACGALAYVPHACPGGVRCVARCAVCVCLAVAERLLHRGGQVLYSREAIRGLPACRPPAPQPGVFARGRTSGHEIHATRLSPAVCRGSGARHRCLV